MSTGEEKIWKILSELAPEEVCRRTNVVFDAESGSYMLSSLGNDFVVSPKSRTISAKFPQSEDLLKKIGYFFRLTSIGYLAMAKDIPPAGRLVKPVNMTGGQLFFRGSHVLPLEKVAGKYGNDREGFLSACRALGGEVLDYGDASVKLLPLPRVPVTVILWLSDEEFPARADLLFDSGVEFQLPIDIIWSIAMMSLIAFL